MASADGHARGAGSNAAGTNRTWSNRSSKNPQQQLTTIEKSVTHLLVATKQLLETLTNWSRGAATETEVSDVYVRLGYEFNIACRAFNAINVETSDLGPVPDLLRSILEQTLSQEANQQSLDRHLPEIRDIIIKLLHGLKKKQQKIRQKAGTSNGESSGDTPTRQSSIASTSTIDTTLPPPPQQQQDDFPSRASSSRLHDRRDTGDLPPRTSSAPQPRNTSPRRSLHQRSRETVSSDSSLSSNAMQNIPVIAPYPQADSMPAEHTYEQQAPVELDASSLQPPAQNSDAFTALQRGADLERRASRRFSAYQIQKHLGTSMNGISAIPPAQHSPVPNRGRDVRESMSAVRSRRSVVQNRSRTRADGAEVTPSSLQNEIKHISKEPGFVLEPPDNHTPLDSPLIKTPPDKIAGYPFPPTASIGPESESIGATLNGPGEVPLVPAASPAQDDAQSVRRTRPLADNRIQTPPPTTAALVPDSSPQAGKELTLFLQYKSKIKKFVLSDGADLTLARLQLAFIEKFAWNTHNNGVDLPEVYIQDPVSGVRHELEDLRDVKERSVLVLNVEALDEVKRHFDDSLGGLKRVVEGIRGALDQQQDAIQLVSNRQQESAMEMAGLVASRSQPPALPSTPGTQLTLSTKDKAGQLQEVQALRRDLAIVRQTYKSFAADINASMSTIRQKAAEVKVAADTALVPNMDGDTGRAYVNKGKKSLSEDSEKIVNRVDDLQDIVEDLRKDVVTRGVRPLTRQLEDVSKEISTATSDLKKLQEYLKREKPIWTKIWEKELQVVCDDRDLLTMQEDLAADLEDDLEKAAATFALVEAATKQQNLQSTVEGTTPGSRVPSRTVLHALAQDQGADPEQARDGVLGEVRALQPNHESRLEAIERAEKARQRELESRAEGLFKKELKTFKLKKSGGVEEVERVRLLKDEMARRENHETKLKRAQERRERREAEAAAALPDMPKSPSVDAYMTVTAVDQSLRDSSPDPPFVEAQEGYSNAP